MKKLMLCAGALLIGAVAFAQTPRIADNLTNHGNANTSDVQQGTDGYSADYQKARVRQLGGLNSAYIRQAGVALNVDQGNSADIYQVGSGNNGDLDQNGFNNRGLIMQAGDVVNGAVEDSNNAVLTQGGNDNGSIDNIGIIQQGDPTIDDVEFGAEGNNAVLTQDGTSNAGRITQLFDRNDATVSQNGDSNIVDVLQDARNDLSDGMEANVVQDGNSNVGVVDQAPSADVVDDSGRSVATLNQFGNENRALQVQRSTATEGEAGETGVINQGDSDGAVSNGATAIQDQRGKGDYAEINQSGSGVSDDGDYAKQRQKGGYNVAVATQDNSTGVASEGNFSFQDQDGWDNQSYNTQLGLGNKAQTKQVGNNNITNTDQDGDSNFASITQMWSNSVANTNQLGGYNHALVNQMEGQSSIVNQNGWHNKAAVFQSTSAFSLPDNQTELIFGDRYEFDTPEITLDPVPHLTITTSPYDND